MCVHIATHTLVSFIIMHVSLCFLQDSAVRVGNLLYGDITYVDGGVQVSVTRVQDGDDEEDETNKETRQKTKKKVILLICMCPYSSMHVSLCFHPCVLNLKMHVSLFL